MVENIGPLRPEKIQPQPTQKTPLTTPLQIGAFKNVLAKKLEELSQAIPYTSEIDKIDKSQMSKILDNLKIIVTMYVELVEAFGREIANFDESVLEVEGKINKESLNRVVALSEDSLNAAQGTAVQLTELFNKIVGNK